MTLADSLIDFGTDKFATEYMQHHIGYGKMSLDNNNEHCLDISLAPTSFCFTFWFTRFNQNEKLKDLIVFHTNNFIYENPDLIKGKPVGTDTIDNVIDKLQKYFLKIPNEVRQLC